MTSHAAAAFDRELNGLFKRRTHWLRSEVRKAKPGKPPSFRSKDISGALNRLLAHTETCLLKGKSIDSMQSLYEHKKQWRSKGRGAEEKRQSFLQWFAANVPHMNCVYVFWAQDECRYVGRTHNGKSRPQSHFKKGWFTGVTRVVILSSKGGRNVPKLECLAWHRYKPKFNRIKPSRKKWHAKCQICEVQKRVKKDVRSLFRLR